MHLAWSTNKTGLSENLEGMTYRPNTQTENKVQENKFSLVELISFSRLTHAVLNKRSSRSLFMGDIFFICKVGMIFFKFSLDSLRLFYFI